MKKTFLSLISALLVASTLFVSCKKTEDAITNNAPIEQRLSKDVVLTNAIAAAKDLYLKTSGGTLNDPKSISTLQAIVAKVNNKTATAADYATAEAILGMPYDAFIKEMQNFGVALNEVNKKYPELAKMNNTELQATFAKAIELNPELKNSLGNTALVNGRSVACPLRDICNLAVTLTKLFAGDAICAAISVSTIPVVGGLLCTLILNIGVGLLTGICNALPC